MTPVEFRCVLCKNCLVGVVLSWSTNCWNFSDVPGIIHSVRVFFSINPTTLPLVSFLWHVWFKPEIGNLQTFTIDCLYVWECRYLINKTNYVITIALLEYMLEQREYHHHDSVVLRKALVQFCDEVLIRWSITFI